MSEVRRRLVRFMILVLPALLLLAAMYAVRGDLRDSAARSRNPGYVRHNNWFESRRRADDLGDWTHEFTELLAKQGTYGFKIPASGFRIEIRSEQGSTRYEPGSNTLIVWGARENLDAIKLEVSRLIARAMLREGAPDAGFSPWFEEGVSQFYKGTQTAVVGSRKRDLSDRAAMNPPASLAAALSARPDSHNFDAVSHSLVAFLHEGYGTEKIAQYAAEERRPGQVPPGTFERIFGAEVEKAWRDDLLRR